MALYAIGDLHLSLNSNKSMEVFGEGWKDYVERIRDGFANIHDDDVTVLCGDLSWGMSLEESLKDFQFINELPGQKIIIKGNHDYWWNTVSKMEHYFTEHKLTSIEFLHNNCQFYDTVALCGTRGWFYELDGPSPHNVKMLQREVGRLETSLLAAGNRKKFCFLHYPPLYHGYECPEILQMLEKYNVTACYYGHLHGASHRLAVNEIRRGIRFSLVSADYLGFIPKKICE